MNGTQMDMETHGEELVCSNKGLQTLNRNPVSQERVRVHVRGSGVRSGVGRA